MVEINMLCYYTVSTKKYATSFFAITLKAVYKFSSNLTGSCSSQCWTVFIKTISRNVCMYATL